MCKLLRGQICRSVGQVKVGLLTPAFPLSVPATHSNTLPHAPFLPSQALVLGPFLLSQPSVHPLLGKEGWGPRHAGQSADLH